MFATHKTPKKGLDKYTYASHTDGPRSNFRTPDIPLGKLVRFLSFGKTLYGESHAKIRAWKNSLRVVESLAEGGHSL